jgi:O-antigen ligase
VGTLLSYGAGLAFAVALGAGLPYLIWTTYHRYAVGLVLVLATFFLEIVWVEFPGFWVGIYLYPTDFVFAFLAVPAFLRLLFARDFPGRSVPWLVFGVLLAASFGVGYAQFGKAAGTELRQFFYVWVSVLYFMSFPLDAARARTTLRAWFAFAALLFLLALARWTAESAGLPIADTWRGTGAAAEFRVLPSGGTLFLLDALVLIVFLMTARTARRWMWVAVPALLATVLVMQHRSVWLTAAGAFLALYLALSGPVRLKLVRPLAGAMIVVAVGGAGLVGYGKLDALVSSVTRSAVQATDSRGTAGGRIYGWHQLLLQLEPAEYVTGKPFGSGYERYDFPNVRWKATYDPHNFYLQTLLRSGVPGLALLLAAYLVTLSRLLRDRSGVTTPDLPPRLLVVLLVSQLVFMVPYRLPYEQAIWLGLAISVAASLRRAAAAGATSGRRDEPRAGAPAVFVGDGRTAGR